MHAGEARVGQRVLNHHTRRPRGNSLHSLRGGHVGQPTLVNSVAEHVGVAERPMAAGCALPGTGRLLGLKPCELQVGSVNSMQVV